MTDLTILPWLIYFWIFVGGWSIGWAMACKRYGKEYRDLTRRSKNLLKKLNNETE